MSASQVRVRSLSAELPANEIFVDRLPGPHPSALPPLKDGEDAMGAAKTLDPVRAESEDLYGNSISTAAADARAIPPKDGGWSTLPPEAPSEGDGPALGPS